MTSAMDDFFGTFPRRPNHPDFWKLSSVVLSLDADSDKGYEVVVGEVIDVDSLTHCAEQRTGRIFGPRNLAENVSSWMDGFMAGVRYGREEYDKDQIK